MIYRKTLGLSALTRKKIMLRIKHLLCKINIFFLSLGYIFIDKLLYITIKSDESYNLTDL